MDEVQEELPVSLRAGQARVYDAEQLSRPRESRLGDVPEHAPMDVGVTDHAATTDLLWSHGDVLIDLAEVLRIAGRFAEAADAAKGAVSIYERKCIVPSGSRARALVAELEGVRG